MFNKKQKKVIRKYFGFIYQKPLRFIRENRANRHIKSEVSRLNSILNKNEENRVFYLGITKHANLGDMAQHYCIKKWIAENFSDRPLYMFESDTVVSKKHAFCQKLSEHIKDDDLIIFQSGYTTTDLGGNHNLMHCMVCNAMPNAHILMMPQTVFFKSDKNKQYTASILNRAKNMLFLARDSTSYATAKEMFPDINVKCYPDIVTSLIGTLHFSHERTGVCLCRRDDGEKFYSEEQLNDLCARIRDDGEQVAIMDTTINKSVSYIRGHLQECIEKQIDFFSHFKVTITDRYHGTIFSLCAGTPVIIIKTTDHKVTTGADWFKGVYDRYVYVAEDLDDAYKKTIKICLHFDYKKQEPYHLEHYYSKLKVDFLNL